MHCDSSHIIHDSSRTTFSDSTRVVIGEMIRELSFANQNSCKPIENGPEKIVPVTL